MRKIEDYILITAREETVLSDKISSYIINDGYQPFGSPIVSIVPIYGTDAVYMEYGQAMVLYGD